MESAASAKDIIKSSILESGLFDTTMTWGSALELFFSLIAALLLGLLIFYVYKKTFSGVVFCRTFAVTLVGLTVLVCMVTLAISTNIILSLGMVGALSIVRFRTAIKDPLDLLFLFWAISAGITAGAASYVLAAAASVLIIALLAALNRRNLGGEIYIMVVHYRGDDIGDRMRSIMKDMKYKIKSKTMRAETTEMAVEVFARKNNLTFAERIRELNGVEDVTLVQYNGEYHG